MPDSDQAPSVSAIGTRTPRARWSAVLEVGALVLLAACTGQPNDPGRESPAATTSTATPADSSSSLPTAATTGTERVEPFIDSCHQAREITTKAFSHSGDVAIGPLSYAGLKYYRAHAAERPNWGSGYFFKSGAQLRPGVSATVSIQGRAAKYAAIITESGPNRGSRAVTYRSCSKSGPPGYWWVGGFVLRDRRTACVPVKVTSSLGPTEHRAVISLGAGDCS
jgi:hypothetical protein